MTHYKFTRPKTKAGETNFFKYLRGLKLGKPYTGKWVKNVMYKGMTFQNLREAGLVTYQNKEFTITPRGELYVAYVNSTNQPNKVVLRTIMEAKCTF